MFSDQKIKKICRSVVVGQKYSFAFIGIFFVKIVYCIFCLDHILRKIAAPVHQEYFICNIGLSAKFLKSGNSFMCRDADVLTENNADNLKEVYNSNKVITLDELPKF